MFGVVDLSIVALFFLVTFLIGVIDRRKVTLEDYWVNGRKTGKFLLIATVTSSFLGVGSLISNAGVAFSGGGFATILLMSSFFFYFLIFGKFFAPKIKEFGDQYCAYTLPDYLEVRYSKRVRVMGLLLNLITYSFFLALQILGIGVFMSTLGGFDPTLATLLGGGIVVLYTAVGGLRADIRTDLFQFSVMVTLILVFLPLIVLKGGGLPKLLDFPLAFLSGKEFAPWYVYPLGFLFLGASNLVAADLWQRAYAAESTESSTYAMTISSFLVFLFLIAGTLFGLFGKILLPDATANTVVPELLRLSLPPFAYGVVLAGFFAAIMSSADTVLLILSMTIVHDLWQKALRKNLPQEKVLSLSRSVTFILGVLAVTVAVMVGSVVHLAIDAVSFYVALLPAVVFGFYTKNASELAAFWSIVLGTLTIIIFLFISPIEAFIPGIIVSFLTFFLFNVSPSPLGRG